MVSNLPITYSFRECTSYNRINNLLWEENYFRQFNECLCLSKWINEIFSECFHCEGWYTFITVRTYSINWNKKESNRIRYQNWKLAMGSSQLLLFKNIYFFIIDLWSSFSIKELNRLHIITKMYINNERWIRVALVSLNLINKYTNGEWKHDSLRAIVIRKCTA